jgi:hypothetical protein
VILALATAGGWVARRRIRPGPVPLGPLLEGLVHRTGGHVQPASTLAELGGQLARLVGPQTAALAAQTERARFAPGPTAPTPHPRIQLARALANDLGPRRALLVLTTPGARRLARQRPAQPADGSAGCHQRVTGVGTAVSRADLRCASSPTRTRRSAPGSTSRTN